MPLIIFFPFFTRDARKLSIFIYYYLFIYFSNHA